MCRIAGIVLAKRSEIDIEQMLSAMLPCLAHGGPDDEGIFVEDDKIAFGHRRLSIIDTSDAGHQPMTSKNLGVVISFNGEIYNYQVLREELKGLGHSFQTATDTEVILCAYQQWGTGAFNKFEGIFAFSLFDKAGNKIFLVRDQIGVKPLYYFIDRKELVFSSEVRAFKALRPNWQENEDWKILFLAFGSMPHPHTTLADVYQLGAGEYLELDLDIFVSRTVQYYNFNEGYRYGIKNTVKAIESTRKLIRKAFRKNMVSDVPVGVFLSGGVDSSLLTLLGYKEKKDITTISLNFEETFFDELPYQKIILEKSLHSQHRSHVATEAMFWENIGDIWSAMDQPTIDGVNSYFISRYARQEGFKVVLSGMGADEIFGGYRSINRIRWIRMLRLLPFKKLLSQAIGYKTKSLRRVVFLKIQGAVGDYLFLRGIHTPDVIADLLNLPPEKIWNTLNDLKIDAPSGVHMAEYVTFLESKIYMTNQLLRDADSMGMWHGVEIRVPFLDIELIDSLKKIHPSVRHKKGWTKFLLTASFIDLLPIEIIFRKKFGFTFPFSVWIKNRLEYFKSLTPRGVAVDQIVRDFERGRGHWSKCWSLAVLKQFGQHPNSAKTG